MTGNLKIPIADENLTFSPEESVDYAETKRLMKEILDGLPEDQKLCVLMYYYEELSVADIADALGCSTGTVKSRLNYARKKIRNDVEELERKGTKLYSVAAASVYTLDAQRGRADDIGAWFIWKRIGETGCRHRKKRKCTHKRKYRFG